ncbi:transposase [Sorangium cellulosum]|uniref:transposase n=1 Tax=Sorangium cellulosum TaxID=56 RepID=UPI001012A03A
MRYVLRPPIAQERVAPQQDGLVRLSLKRAFADGTVAASMDPLSLLCRLATSVPPPRFHTVKYAGVLASASRPRRRASASDRALRSRDSPRRPTTSPLPNASGAAIGRSTNRAELLRRTFAIDVLECPVCKGRMKLVALLTEPSSIARFLTALGEPTDVPGRSPSADAAAAVLGVRGAGRRRRPGAPSVEEHRPAPQGARGRRVAARTSRARPTPGGRRVPAARQCAPLRARRRAGPTLSTHERRVATLAVPPLRFAAPQFFAQRSGFFYLRARLLLPTRRGARAIAGAPQRAPCGA